MNKQQFLDAVRTRLAGLPKNDIDRFLDYCREMIDDRMEDGLSEEEAVAAMGTPEYVASQFLMDTASPKSAQPLKQRRDLKTWQVVLIVLGSPVWVPVLFGVAVAVVSIVIGAAAALFGLYCAAVSLTVTGAGLLLFGGTIVAMPDLLFVLAAGCLLIAIGLLMVLGCNCIVGWIIRLAKWLFRTIRSRFTRKEA